MKAVFQKVQHLFSRSDTVMKLILVNSVLFIIFQLLLTIARLFQWDITPVETAAKLLYVPASLHKLMLQPWSLFTYAFMHAGILHILFNMLWLYWMGKIFAEYLGNAKLLATYFAGALCGAVLYVAAYNIFPLFHDAVSNSYALGASASVLAVTVAVATLLPDYTIHLLFFGAVRMKYLAVVLILIDLLSISGENAGGHIAHLGGAIYGFVFIRLLRKGSNTGWWLEKVFAFTGNLFGRKPVMKIAYRRQEPDTTSFPSQTEIDRILEKISKSGYMSLTIKEKETLERASRK